MPSHDVETLYELRVAIIVCHCLYDETFKAIEGKIGVTIRIAQKIYQRVCDRAENDDFNDFFCCFADLERVNKSNRVFESTEFSRTMKKFMLKHFNLQPFIAILNQENVEIFDKKRFSRSLIERVQHEHEHFNENGKRVSEFVRDKIAKKFRIEVDDDKQRKSFCD